MYEENSEIVQEDTEVLRKDENTKEMMIISLKYPKDNVQEWV